MKYKYLRAQIKAMSPPTDFILKECKVIIDGRTFFKDTYRQSGCLSILGGEYDRYANYLRILLKQFKESDVTCYVVFNGAMDADIARREELHQKVIDKANSASPLDENAFFSPILMKDIWKQVLDELDIKYYVTENDSKEYFVRAAQRFNCPLVTADYEYTLLYASVIPPRSLKFNEESKSINCQIFDSETVRTVFSLKHPLLPLFFTLIDEATSYFNRLPNIVQCTSKDLLTSVLRWTRWQRDCVEDAIKYIFGILSDKEGKEFLKNYEYNTVFIVRKKIQDIEVVEQGGGVIAVPYVNLLKNRTFSGSWAIYDKEQEDAMLPSLDIVWYIYCLLEGESEVKITFIGRKGDQSCSWDIVKDFYRKIPINPKELAIGKFLKVFLPGFDLAMLLPLPKDCWILIITLVYFYKLKMDMNLAYSVILSYVMLAHVFDRVGVINPAGVRKINGVSSSVPEDDQDKHSKSDLKHNDCIAAVTNLIDLFYVRNLRRRFAKDILHRIAEFQHCLQHINYFNNLFVRLKPTVYHKTLNSTFVYNMYLKLQRKDDNMEYFKKRLRNSSVFELFRNIGTVFEACLVSAGLLVEQEGSSEPQVDA